MAELTREQILAMEAGPELDALVRIRVFGFADFAWVLGLPVFYSGDQIPPVSTDIAAAWEVRAKMFALTFSKRMRFLSALQEAVTHRLHMGGAIHPGDVPLFMEAEDICKAALLLTLTEAE